MEWIGSHPNATSQSEWDGFGTNHRSQSLSAICSTSTTTQWAATVSYSSMSHQTHQASYQAQTSNGSWSSVRPSTPSSPLIWPQEAQSRPAAKGEDPTAVSGRSTFSTMIICGPSGPHLRRRIATGSSWIGRGRR